MVKGVLLGQWVDTCNKYKLLKRERASASGAKHSVKKMKMSTERVYKIKKMKTKKKQLRKERGQGASEGKQGNKST